MSASIIIVEACALQDRINEVYVVGYKKLIIEGDNMVIIKALLSMTFVVL